MKNYDDLSSRMLVDFEDVKEGLAEILDELQSLRNDSFIKKILSDKDIQRIKDWEGLLKKRASDEFSVVVMGDFKRGKSTLINAVLGKNVAPADVSPETITINKISFGEDSLREAVLKNGKRLRLNADELGRSELEQIIQRIPAPIDHIEIQENIPILKEISIVDTPGLGDVLKSFEDQVQDYLNRADAVIYVVSVLSPLSESEQAYLCASILPQRFSRLLVAANMSDCLDTEEDIQKVKREIVQRVSAFSENASVYAVSALDEYCRKLSYQRPNPELSGFLQNSFLEFEADIQNEIVLQKDLIKTQRVLALAKAMASDVRKRIEVISNMLKLNREQLEKMSQKCEEENANLHQTLQNAEGELKSTVTELFGVARNWIAEFLERLKKEIQQVQKNGETVLIQKHFQFYLIDMVREAILKCLEEHAIVIEGKIRNIARNFSHQALFDHPGEQLSEIAVDIADISWTGADTASFVLTEGAYLLGLSDQPTGLSFIGQTIAGFVRESRMKKKQVDLLKPVLDDFDKLEDQIYGQLRRAYDSFYEKSCEKLEESFEQQLKASKEAVQQAIDVANQEQVKTENVEAQIQSAYQILSHIDQIIENYQ